MARDRGVVADTKYTSLAEAPEPQVYLPYLQTGGELYVQLCTAAAPGISIGAVRDAMVNFDHSVATDVRTTPGT